MTLGIQYDPFYLRHHPGPGHPERPDRVATTWRHLQTRPWFPELVPTEGRDAPREALERIHAPEYLERARAACARGEPWLDVPDVGICPESFDVAVRAAGAGLALADAVVSGHFERGFALIRPPGHHAERTLALGFCLLNNVAILARHLQAEHGIDRVLILDWDVHHGNGTQHAFEADPGVFYVSLHQYPFYPGTGAASERGVGAGLGTTLNCPMPAGADDASYERAFEEQILPAAEAFRPEFVLISAGFDAHRLDPLAEVELSTECYRWMTRKLCRIADTWAGGRIVSLLEGGYSLEALPECVAVHLEALLEGP